MKRTILKWLLRTYIYLLPVMFVLNIKTMWPEMPYEWPGTPQVLRLKPGMEISNQSYTNCTIVIPADYQGTISNVSVRESLIAFWIKTPITNKSPIADCTVENSNFEFWFTDAVKGGGVQFERCQLYHNSEVPYLEIESWNHSSPTNYELARDAEDATLILQPAIEPPTIFSVYEPIVTETNWGTPDHGWIITWKRP